MLLIILQVCTVFMLCPGFLFHLHAFQNFVRCRENCTTVVINPYTALVVHPTLIGVIVAEHSAAVVVHTLCVACVVKCMHWKSDRRCRCRRRISDCNLIIILHRFLIEALAVFYCTMQRNCTVGRAALFSVPFLTHQVTAAVNPVHHFHITAAPESEDGTERHIRFGL